MNIRRFYADSGRLDQVVRLLGVFTETLCERLQKPGNIWAVVNPNLTVRDGRTRQGQLVNRSAKEDRTCSHQLRMSLILSEKDFTAGREYNLSAKPPTPQCKASLSADIGVDTVTEVISFRPLHEHRVQHRVPLSQGKPAR